MVGAPEELVSQSVALPGAELRVLQPREAVDLPDSGGVEWPAAGAELVVLWRSGVALRSTSSTACASRPALVELAAAGVPGIAAGRAGRRRAGHRRVRDRSIGGAQRRR